MRQAVTPDQDITPERVRWFADYHVTHPEWGVFHVALEDGNYECGASDPGIWEGETQEVRFMADWFDGLTEDQREELARRVSALEEVRRQDRKVTPRDRDTVTVAVRVPAAAVAEAVEAGRVTIRPVPLPSTSKRPGGRGCLDLDPMWPGPDGEPRGFVSCAIYPNCSCGAEDARLGQLTGAEIEAIAKTNPQPQIVQVAPRHAKTWTAAGAAAGWTGDAAYHDELAAGRLGENARKVYGWVLEAMAKNGGAPVTAAEALDQRVRNVNLFRARMTELFYQGALVKAPARACNVTHRQAITWKAVPPPWTPVAHRRTGPLVLRPLLREAAALIRELAGYIEGRAAAPPTTSEQVMDRLLERAIERAREYDNAASDGYGGGRTNPNGRV